MPVLNANSTPVKGSQTDRGIKQYSQQLVDAAQAKKEHGEDMNGHWIGPSTPEEFVRRLMGITPKDLKALPAGVDFALPVREAPGAKLEKHLYQLFEETIKEFNISPKFKFFIGADGRPKAGDVNVPYRPDGGVHEIIRESEPEPKPKAEHGYNLRPSRQKLIDGQSNDPESTANVPRKAFDWFGDGLVVEFKKASWMDPFYSREELIKLGAVYRSEPISQPDAKPDTELEAEPKPKPEESGSKLESQSSKSQSDGPPLVSFVKLTDEACKVRGQLALYAKEVFDHQHRTHIFQLLVCGRHARFIFWDHSGAIVSDSFNYVENPELMAEFFWRYNHMTPQARGWDLSVQDATKDEAKIFKEEVELFLKNMEDPNHPQRRLTRAADTLHPAFPVHKITIEDELTGERADVLIQAPFFHVHSALGRATRGYVAYHLIKKKLMFLKDTWRVVHDRLIAERKLYHELEEAGVPNVPVGVFGGDVKFNDERETTRCAQWAEEQTLSVLFEDIRKFHHHRLLQELAYPVEGAPYSYEVACAFRDCLEAIGGANSLCSLLHRDISVGNVMLREGRACLGILADWDHAAKMGTPSSDEKHQKYRTGTWQFMSVALLGNPNKSHEILDDFESIFWGLLHTSLHYFKHKNHQVDMKMFDEQERKKIDGLWYLCGGTKKRAALSGGISSLVTFDSPGLKSLINDLAAEFHNYYLLVEAVSRHSEVKEDSRKPQDRDRGKIQPFRERPIQRPEAPQRVAQDNPEEAQRKLKECREKLSSAKFWIDLFDDALADTSRWWPDACGFDQYPSRTQKQEAKNIAIDRLSSMHTGSQLAAETAAAVQLHKENMESDDDDKEESCECKEDAEARMEEMAEEPPVSEPPSPTSTSFTGFHTPPRRSQTARASPTRSSSSSLPLLSDSSDDSRPSKRDIEKVVVASSSSIPEPPPQKRTRSRLKAGVTAAPTTRTTRSSSKKSTVPSQAAEEADTAAKEKKATRPRRALKKAQSSVDVIATQPRRERLRSKPARSTQHGKD